MVLNFAVNFIGFSINGKILSAHGIRRKKIDFLVLVPGRETICSAAKVEGRPPNDLSLQLTPPSKEGC